MTPETPSEEATPISDRAWKALEGAYDLQVHVGPDVIARRIDDIDCAKEFLAHGMKGFVLKSHYMQTGERAQVVTKAVPGSRVFGAITLNHSVGGLNPVAVELAGRTGCKIVWFPTVDAAERNRRPSRRRVGQAAVLGQDSARARGRRHFAAAALGDRRGRPADRAGAPLPRAHRQAQHDPGDRAPRSPGDLRARARREGARRQEGARHPCRVPVAESDRRRAERARGSRRHHRALLHDDLHEQGAVGDARSRTSARPVCRGRSSRPTSARPSIRRSPKGSPCSRSACSTPASRSTRSGRWP